MCLFSYVFKPVGFEPSADILEGDPCFRWPRTRSGGRSISCAGVTFNFMCSMQRSEIAARPQPYVFYAASKHSVLHDRNGLQEAMCSYVPLFLCV